MPWPHVPRQAGLPGPVVPGAHGSLCTLGTALLYSGQINFPGTNSGLAHQGGAAAESGGLSLPPQGLVLLKILDLALSRFAFPGWVSRAEGETPMAWAILSAEIWERDSVSPPRWLWPQQPLWVWAVCLLSIFTQGGWGKAENTVIGSRRVESETWADKNSPLRVQHV